MNGFHTCADCLLESTGVVCELDSNRCQVQNSKRSLLPRSTMTRTNVIEAQDGSTGCAGELPEGTATDQNWIDNSGERRCLSVRPFALFHSTAAGWCSGKAFANQEVAQAGKQSTRQQNHSVRAEFTTSGATNRLIESATSNSLVAPGAPHRGSVPLPVKAPMAPGGAIRVTGWG